MNKIGSIVIVGFLIIGGLGTVAFSNELHNVKMTVHFSHLMINDKDNFASVQLEGANSVLMKYNHYKVPTRIETFVFPFGTRIVNISCVPNTIHGVLLTKELSVTPEPVLLKNMNGQKNKTRDMQPLTPTGWYDYDIGTGIDRNEEKVIVKIQLYPLQYKPIENTIEWTEQIDINIQYEESQKPKTVTNGYDFIILSPREYADELEDLVIHKNTRGIRTKLVTLNDVYTGNHFPVDGRDESEEIKFFIKHAIEQWGIHSVLLVGGYQAVPTRTVQPQNSFVSDLYYADIYDSGGSFCSWDSDGDNKFGEYDEDMVDLYPDVYLGRLACINEDQVTTCVNKIINFELNKGYSQEWFERFVVVAGDCFPNQGICEGESATQVAMEIMDDFIPDIIWASNGRLSGTNPTGIDEITTAINKGCGFFYFSGHSSPTSFFTFAPNNSNKKLPTPTGYYSITHIAELSNDDKLPIVVFDSCSPCKFDPYDDCIGWTYISTKEGGGIGFLGATTTSLCYLGEDFTKGLAIKLALNVFDVYKNTNVSTLGEVWKNAIVQYMYPNMTISDYITLEQWEPFMDPTLLLNECSLAPEKPQKPEGRTSGKMGEEYDYSSFTIDPEGDMVYYFFDWGDETNSGWLGPYHSGQKCVASHIWNEQGKYELRVKAKDVHGVESEWSDTLSVSMPKNRIVGNHRSLGLFDWFLTSLMRIGHFPSLAAAILKDDELIWSDGYGFYDIEHEKFATEDTVYNIASISKTITSTALMQLCEQGLFDLDDDVNDYLPFTLRNPNFPEIPITFRMLLSHQSGLAEDPIEYYQYSYTFGGDSPVPLYPFLETYLVPHGNNYSVEVWSNDMPGNSFHYANIGFALIGFLVEQISGLPFDQYCNEHIFRPLSMENTSYRLSDIDSEHLAVPYDFSDGEYIKNEQYGYIDYPAGTVRTSISELSHFLIAHMNEGLYHDVRLLNEDTVDLMHSVQYPNSHYGLGWGIVTSSIGYKYIGHEGGDIGIVTSMYIRESDNTAVIIFVNVSPWTMNAGIWYLMKDILFLKATSMLGTSDM